MGAFSTKLRIFQFLTMEHKNNSLLTLPCKPPVQSSKVRLRFRMRQKDACITTVNSSLVYESQDRLGAVFGLHRPLERG